MIVIVIVIVIVRRFHPFDHGIVMMIVPGAFELADHHGKARPPPEPWSV
jgi:hypothetical protein